MELLVIVSSPKVCVSRRALKHFVERRKDEGLSAYMMCKAIDLITSAVLRYDTDEYFEPNKHVYTKHFYRINMPSLRVVTEVVNNHLQIKSIHYRIYKKSQRER